MAALTEMLALELAEEASGLSPLDRAVLIFARLEDIAPKEAAELAVDVRDRHLIDAHIRAFGSRISFYAPCPDCGAGHEADFDLKALPATAAEPEVRRKIDGRAVRLRAPSSLELAAAAAADDPGLLMRACARPAPKSTETHFAEQVEIRMSEAFPLLNVMFEFRCDECSAQFSSRFDIGEWLWREISVVARSAIDAVDRLARAYGWGEAEILGMSPRRRAMYLAQVTA